MAPPAADKQRRCVGCLAAVHAKEAAPRDTAQRGPRSRRASSEVTVSVGCRDATGSVGSKHAWADDAEAAGGVVSRRDKIGVARILGRTGNIVLARLLGIVLAAFENAVRRRRNQERVSLGELRRRRWVVSGGGGTQRPCFRLSSNIHMRIQRMCVAMATPGGFRSVEPLF